VYQYFLNSVIMQTFRCYFLHSNEQPATPHVSPCTNDKR